MKKHGMYDTKIYRVWVDMKSRCYCENDTGYKNYGGRGIAVCEEWKSSSAFLEWAIPRWKEGLQLDRIDNDKDYSPENCWFATKSYQTLNQRSTRRNGVPKGVNWDKDKKKYRSRIYILGKEKHLGFFDTIDEAKKARDAALEGYKAEIESAPKHDWSE